MKQETKDQLIKKINRKLKRVSKEKLKDIIYDLKPKPKQEMEMIKGVFKSKELGKLHVIMMRPKPNLDPIFFNHLGVWKEVGKK